jgi:hypothetical protein
MRTIQESQKVNKWVMDNLPVLSTAHVPSDFAYVLEEKSGVIFAPTPDGGFLFISDEAKQHLPAEYHPLCDWALSQNSDGFWLRLDCDGDQYDELKTFNW